MKTGIWPDNFLKTSTDLNLSPILFYFSVIRSKVLILCPWPNITKTLKHCVAQGKSLVSPVMRLLGTVRVSAGLWSFGAGNYKAHLLNLNQVPEHYPWHCAPDRPNPQNRKASFLVFVEAAAFKLINKSSTHL